MFVFHIRDDDGISIKLQDIDFLVRPARVFLNPKNLSRFYQISDFFKGNAAFLLQKFILLRIPSQVFHAVKMFHCLPFVNVSTKHSLK